MGGGGGLGGVVEAIGDIFNSAVDFVTSVVGGFVKAVGGVIMGVIEGDWSKVVRSVTTVVMTIIYVVAIIYGGVLGAAAGIAALDALYNDAKLTKSIVKTAGAGEKALFGTDVIDSYATEITAIVSFTAAMYAGYVGGSILFEVTGIGSMMEAIPSELTSAIDLYLGVQDTLAAYNSIGATKAYYEALLAEYHKKIMVELSAARAQKELWFSLMSGYESKNRIMPGGDLFNGGTGTYFFNPTSPHENARYMLAIPYGGDATMDESLTGRVENRHAGGALYLNQVEETIKWPK